jgi:hypothetical protein
VLYSSKDRQREGKRETMRAANNSSTENRKRKAGSDGGDVILSSINAMPSHMMFLFEEAACNLSNRKGGFGFVYSYFYEGREVAVKDPTPRRQRSKPGLARMFGISYN